MDERQFSKYFKAFGDPSRLRILTLLSSKEMTVSELVVAAGMSQPTVSRHLAILRGADIVIDRREGQNVYYSLNKVSIENCCDGFCCGLAIKVDTGKKSKKK
jgi:ArsR family transcriptional regulator, arsenate/arsenite/antimonite-responsive transcriptional repressor